MIWFENLKTAQKLLLFFAVMAAFLGLTVYEGASAASAMKQNQEATFKVDLKSVSHVRMVQIERLRISRFVLLAIIEDEPAKIDALMRQIDDTEARVKRLSEEARPLLDETSRAELAEFARAFEEFAPLAREAIRYSPRGADKGDPAKLAATLARTSQLGLAIDAKLQGIAERAEKTAEARAAASSAEYEKNLQLSLGVFVVVLLVGGAFTRGISLAIARPLKDAVGLLERVAEGDLTGRLALSRTDELGAMATALNASLEAMRDTLSTVASVSTEVSSASQELSENATQISSGAQSQAASLEETAASLEEISATVKQNTDGAQEAAQLATSARDVAERGGAVVGAAVAAMEEITKSSKQIADIIATIDEIAFQTNLLALNAAVEAARAGEQGRGFAVVASEVRTLAQRTGSAAKEIRGLIADSSAKVEVGTQQVNESGRTLEELVKSVKKVTDMVSEITAASREQSAGIDQVNVAVTQVDQVTQSNAAQTEELSATATSLADKAAHLQRLVSAFQLGGAKVAAPEPRRLAPRPKAQRPRGGQAAGLSAALAPLPKAAGFEEV